MPTFYPSIRKHHDTCAIGRIDADDDIPMAGEAKLKLILVQG